MPLLAQVLVFFAAIVVAVPLFRRLGLGSVLGYLAAGAVIGPYGAALIPDAESTLHFAELGVVLLLFAIGLELQPSRLWALRGPVFGLGGVQVVVTTALFTGLGAALGLGWTAAAIVAFGLSMSSTALVLQLLGERGENDSAHGKAAFGILLFQDLAVVPMLALIPQGDGAEAGPAPWWTWLNVPAVLLILLFGGRYVVRPALRRVAAVKVPEVFTAAALLVVVGTALFVSKIGLSMALGAFLAGVLLSDSEYRHELEADLAPFKGLLLGLFFTAVGMNANLWLLLLKPGSVFGLVFAIVLVKAAVLFAIGRWRLEGRDGAATLAVALSQGGEFAFVLFGLARGGGLLDEATSDVLTVAVTLSMVTTPVLMGQYVKRLRPRLGAGSTRPFDVAVDEQHPVIIAGMGRVGQVVARVLRGKRIGFTALDINPEHIEFMKRFGNKVFFGDASRVELLRAAKAEEARIFVLAIDDVEASVRTAEVVKKQFPHLRIYARARNRQHVYKLLALGITDFIRETWDSSLLLTEMVLEGLGTPHERAHRIVTKFSEQDVALLHEAARHSTDLQKLTEIAARGRAELEQLFAKDAAEATDD